MIKRMILLSTFIMGGLISIAQTHDFFRHYAELDTIISFKHIYPTQSQNIVYDITDTNILFTNFNKSTGSDTITFYTISLPGYQIDSFAIFSPGIQTALAFNNVSSPIAVTHTNNVLAISLLQTIIIYSRSQSTDYAFTKTIWIPKDCPRNNPELLNDSTLILQDFNWDNNHDSTVFALYNINNNTLVKKATLPYNHPILWHIKPNHIVSTNNGITVMADINEYTLHVLDNELNVKQQFHYTPNSWKFIPKKQIRKKAKYTDCVDNIQSVYSIFNDYDKICWCYVIDNQHILTSRYPRMKVLDTNTFAPTIDIWKMENETWNLVRSDLIEIGLNPHDSQDTLYSKKNYPIGWFEGNNIEFTNNYIVSFSKYGMVEKPLGLSKDEYYNQCQEYAKSNSPFLQIQIFKHSLSTL